MSPDIVTLFHDKREKYNVDRRLFLLSTPWLLTTGKRLLSGQTPPPSGTPVAAERPDPIDLGSNVTLLDYRIHPGEPLAMIGEIRNEGDEMIDAPTISVTYSANTDKHGFSWLSPIIPVIDSKGTVPIFGTLPNTTDQSGNLREFRFSTCTPVESGRYTEEHFAQSFDISVQAERVEPQDYQYRAVITNTSGSSAGHATARGIVRDADGRVAGMTPRRGLYGLRPHASVLIALEANPKVSHLTSADPWMLVGRGSYTVDISLSVRGPVTPVGCSFGFPWDGDNR